MEEKDAKGFFSWQLSKYEKMDPIEDVIGLAIEERETGQIIGHGGIGKHDELDETAIFYGIVRASRRQGYATEASRVITKWALKTFPIPHISGTAPVATAAWQRARTPPSAGVACGATGCQ